MDKTPVVSVLMGIFYRHNDITLLKRSVDSILNQTFTSFELLVCDDGSVPTATTYMDEVAALDPRVRLIRSGTLFTLPSKLNACLSAAQGTWIARMDDDDFSYPERFSVQLEYLHAHPQFSFVGCNVNLWRDGAIVGQRMLPEFPTVQNFYFVQPYIHPTLIFRRDALSAIGGYSEDPSCILCEDYDLLLRLYAAGYSGANLQKYLFDYTIPPTAKGRRTMRHRWNETVTRYRRFRDLGVLPQTLPYIIKPIIVGLLPEQILRKLKK